MKTSRNALTLIEVLVVLAILILLAAVMVPILNAKRERKNRADCLSYIRQIGLACQLYTQDYVEYFPILGKAENSNDLMPLLNNGSYLTITYIYVCPSDRACRRSLVNKSNERDYYSLVPQAGRTPNINSYAYVSGLTQKSPSDSPLAGDNLMDVTSANDKTVQQFQKRVGCSTKGSNHSAAGGNVVFLDGHSEWNEGIKLQTRWVDGDGGTKGIKNPNGL